MTLPSAAAITDYVWCLACEEPHTIDEEGRLALRGEDLPSFSCLTPTHVDELPDDWENTYTAYYEGSGYDLYEHSAAPTADHCPLYFLETP